MNKKGWMGVGGAIGVLVLIAGIAWFSADPEEGHGAQFHVGTFTANNSLITTSSHGTSDGDFLLARRIAIITDSQHAIIKRSSKKLAEALRAVNGVDAVDVLDMGSEEAGGLLYDMYILVEMPAFESKGLLATGRKVNAKIRCSLGRGIWNSNHGYTDQLSPALSSLKLTTTLEHESTSYGIESPNVRWKQVVDDVSKQLSGALMKPLNECAAKFPAPAALPRGLYPAYRPRPELPAPWNTRLKEVFNGHGFMTHNQSVLTMHSTNSFEDLNTTRDMLVERGWRMNTKQFEEGDGRDRYYYRATFDNLISEAFEVREYGARASNESVRLVFRYAERMKLGDIAAAFEAEYGAGEIPLDVWLSFERVLPKAVNERMLESLTTQPVLAASAEKRVIRYLKKTGRSEEAMARIRPAYLSAVLDGSDAVKAIIKLGRELTEDDQWEPREPDASEFLELGLRRLESNEPVELELELNESARFLVGRDDKLAVFSVRVEPSAIPEGRYTLSSGNYSIAHGNRGSSGVTPHSKETPWKATQSDHLGGYHCQVAAEELADGRFKVTVKGRE